MAQPDDLEARVSALETGYSELAKEVRGTKQDAAAARLLAGAADRDVSEFRTEIRNFRAETRAEIRDFRNATTASFNALREDHLDLRHDVADLRHQKLRRTASRKCAESSMPPPPACSTSQHC